MNVFVPEKPKVRVFVDCHGDPIAALQNIVPELQIEVVTVPNGKTVDTVDATLPDSLPYLTSVDRIEG